MSEEKKTEQQAEPEKKSPGIMKSLGPAIVKSLLVVVLVLVASAGGGVVSWVLISRSGVLPTVSAPEETKEEAGDEMRQLLANGAVIELDPFVVNLADTDAARYLRVTITLMVDDKTTVNEVIENITMLSKTRDIILQTLSRKTSSDIIDEEGKNTLRAEILERLGPFYHDPKVVDVMFTEFVIQL